MRSWLPLLLVAAAVQPAAAQRAVRLAVGITRSADLAHDAVLENTALKLAIAPTVTAGVAIPINSSGSYRVVVEAGYGTSTMSAKDLTNTSSDLGKVATLSTSAMLDGRIHGALRWQAGAGVLFYRPANNSGVFLEGPTHRYQVAGGMSYTHPLSHGVDLLVFARYGFHEFTTATYTERGYSSYQSVHRLGLHLGVERHF